MDSKVRGLLGALVQILMHRAFVPACLLGAFMVRVAWIAWIDAQPTSDYQWYFSQGLRIAEGKGYSVDHDGFPLWEPGQALDSPRPTAFWPVGYPAFLGALFWATGLASPLLIAKLANALLYVGVIVSMAYSARIIFRSVLAERATLLLVAFIPNHVAYTTLTSVEIYFAFLVSSGIAFALHARRHRSIWFLALSGLVFGVATLTKPQALLLPGLMLLLLDWNKPVKLLQRGALIYAPLLLVLLPWTLRNYDAFGRVFLVSTNGWINLLIGNTPGSFGGEGLMWNRDLHDIITRYRSELAWNDAAKEVALDHLGAEPERLLTGLPKKMLWLYMGDVDGFGWNRAADAAHESSAFWTPLRVLSQGYYVVLVVGAVASAFITRRIRSRYFGVGPVLVAYFTTVYIVFFGGSRYHFPMVPWFAAYTAGAFAFLAHRAGAVTLRREPVR